MTTRETVYDDTKWEYEPPDPSVGLFGESWAHLVCTKEYDQGVIQEDTAHRSLPPTASGALYMLTTTRLTCLDCGATTTFKHEEYLGHEGEDL